MKLTIITINYNNAEGLRKTLASVAAQTYTNIEHIIVDGGSTDDSVDIIRDYSQSPIANTHEIRWISEKDKGIYNAMNKGIEIALGKRIVNSFNRSELVEDKNKDIEIALGKLGVTDDHHSTPLASRLSPDSLSEYIQILNSGDMLADADVTKNMISQLTQSQESISILYGNMIKAYPNGKRVKDTCLGDSKSKKENLFIRETQWTMYDFIKGTINHDPTYIHRDLYEKYGLYDDTLKIVSDWKWFVNAVVLGAEKVFYIPMNVTIFDMTGISETNLEAREIERHRELEKILPAAILADYDTFHFPINQYKRLKRHGLWRLVYFIERVLFKLEKWHILSK